VCVKDKYTHPEPSSCRLSVIEFALNETTSQVTHSVSLSYPNVNVLHMHHLKHCTLYGSPPLWLWLNNLSRVAFADRTTHSFRMLVVSTGVQSWWMVHEYFVMAMASEESSCHVRKEDGRDSLSGSIRLQPVLVSIHDINIDQESSQRRSGGTFVEDEGR
jgi:hypothetical protein